MWNSRQVSSTVVFVIVFFGVASAQCPQNLGSCKCIKPAVPGSAIKPVLDCSQVSDPNEFQNIEGLQGNQPGGPPVFSQIIVRRSQLQEIPPNAFGVARAAEYIIENNPNLETIERGALGSNANPTLISVRNNPLLETIQYEDFNRYTDIEILRLNDNRLLEVPDFAFDGISAKLREINLERNVILDIGSFAFRNLPALKKVNLAENQIGALESGALFFSNPPDIVDLSRNRLVSIDGDAFSDPSFPNRGAYAKHIDLSNNAISLLDRNELEKIFSQLDKLEKIANPTPAPPTTELPPAAVEPAVVPSAPEAVAPSAPAAVAPSAPAAATAPASAPAAQPAAPAQAPRSIAAPAPAANPATENLLLQILERLQQLTSFPGAQQPAAAAPVRRKRSMAVMAAAFPQSNPLEQFMPSANELVLPPSEIPGKAARNEPKGEVVTSAADAMVSAFQPFFKGKEELMEAIKTNPEAAVAAANAVQIAAEAAAASASAVETAAAGAAAAVEQAVVAAVRGLPRDPESSSRKKRQAPVEPTPAVSSSEPPVVPASIYTVNFAGNPITCSCDAKWVADFRHRYEDQLQNMICVETRDSLFKLDFTHWSRLSC